MIEMFSALPLPRSLKLNTFFFDLGTGCPVTEQAISMISREMGESTMRAE